MVHYKNYLLLLFLSPSSVISNFLSTFLALFLGKVCSSIFLAIQLSGHLFRQSMFMSSFQSSFRTKYVYTLLKQKFVQQSSCGTNSWCASYSYGTNSPFRRLHKHKLFLLCQGPQVQLQIIAASCNFVNVSWPSFLSRLPPGGVPKIQKVCVCVGGGGGWFLEKNYSLESTKHFTMSSITIITSRRKSVPHPPFQHTTYRSPLWYQRFSRLNLNRPEYSHLCLTSCHKFCLFLAFLLHSEISIFVPVLFQHQMNMNSESHLCLW